MSLCFDKGRQILISGDLIEKDMHSENRDGA